MASKKGLIDKQLQGQLQTVFYAFDTDKKDALTYDQFSEYVYSIGMKFITKDYDAQVVKELFGWDPGSKRVRFNAFFDWLESNSIHEFTQE